MTKGEKMDNMMAFMMGEVHMNDPLMVFDWDKAAQILVERMPRFAIAGLEDDFEYTAGLIWCDGKPYNKDYTYLASTWARPMLEIDGEHIECWRFQSEVPEWNSGTKWPKSSLEIVKAAS